MSEITVPDKPRGRPPQSYYDQLEQFANDLRKEDSRLDFSMSARGWAYFLENEGEINKSEIDWAQGKINDLRMDGTLPIDFTAKDDSRKFDCMEDLNYKSPKHYMELKGGALVDGRGYDISFWDTQDCFIQVLVEKIDLKELFLPICRKYNIPIATAKGWPSIRQRATIASRFYEWRQNGNKPIFLYCGDFDPAGVSIANNQRKMLSDLKDAKIPIEGGDKYIRGWTPHKLEINRFGLTLQQIKESNLTWIDNLETANDNDLADPNHSSYETYNVPEWLDKYGERKVEANALVTNPSYGRKIFRNTVKGYLGENPLQEYKRKRDARRKAINSTLSDKGVPSAIQEAIDDI